MSDSMGAADQGNAVLDWSAATGVTTIRCVRRPYTACAYPSGRHRWKWLPTGHWNHMRPWAGWDHHSLQGNSNRQHTSHDIRVRGRRCEASGMMVRRSCFESHHQSRLLWLPEENNRDSLLPSPLQPSQALLECRGFSTTLVVVQCCFPSP
jgi:hypothetical protein